MRGLVGKMRCKSSTLQSGGSAEDRTERTRHSSTQVVASSAMVDWIFFAGDFADSASPWEKHTTPQVVVRYCVGLTTDPSLGMSTE